jgi:hypothetical protein
MPAPRAQALLLLTCPAVALAQVRVAELTPPWAPRWLVGTTVAVLLCTLLARMPHWLPLLLAVGAAALWAVVRLSDGGLVSGATLPTSELTRPEVLPIYRVLVVAQALLPPAAVLAAVALRTVRRSGRGPSL